MVRQGILIYEIPTGDELPFKELSDKLKKFFDDLGISAMILDLDAGIETILQRMR